MSDTALQDKVTYFQEQELLNISDDEREFPSAKCALDNFERPPLPPFPAKLVRRPSSFLGPTPKERQRELETLTMSTPTVAHIEGSGLTRPLTVPESDITRSFPVTKRRQRPSSSPTKPGATLKKTASMPDLTAQDDVPFYKRMGVVPRELKNGKNVKIADHIKLDPEDKQLLKGKVVYFFPNDDVSIARRRRLHKVIQLGAAWVKNWRDDVAYVMVDDGNCTYSQVLRNINKARLPVGFVS
jgi:DNA polymerase IV